MPNTGSKARLSPITLRRGICFCFFPGRGRVLTSIDLRKHDRHFARRRYSAGGEGSGFLDILPPRPLVGARRGYTDACTPLYGSGPAFYALIVEAIADGGVMVGLPRRKPRR
ncbi:unnamed protein product [Tuber aestivum]|uniref:Pyrroline-5-carboxylate reductase dimerisation domain-containing protein n=1 Tax=Tuber aestivum TaxID=59557 RepID=A0A292PYN8_9PEZI|nr:unnamed protein product [Tuber aestivum]